MTWDLIKIDRESNKNREGKKATIAPGHMKSEREKEKVDLTVNTQK